MNKTLKLLIIAAGSVLVIGLMATSCLGGILLWRLRGAAQPALAASGLSAWPNAPEIAPQPGERLTPSSPQNGNLTQPSPWRSSGMMGGWENGWMHGGRMGGWWNNNDSQTTPQSGYCWGCGMHGWGMMNGWGFNGGQNAAIPEPSPNANVSFQRDVLPIFQENCAACHGGTAELYLDSYANVIQGGRSGAVIVPGDPQASLLIQYVAGGYMPFRGQPLTDAETQLLVNWVAAGAQDN